MDPAYIVCVRPMAVLCQHYSTPFWPLPLRSTGISQKGQFKFAGVRPKESASAYFSPDYYASPVLCLEPSGCRSR